MKEKQNRKMKVYEVSGYRYKATPQIRLQGQWLADYGFMSGNPVNVECRDGQLIITKICKDTIN